MLLSKLHISTERLRLRPWHNNDRDDFAMLHADPVVMADLGGVISREEADAKFDRYGMAWATHGYGRWSVSHCNKRFLGYVGVMPRRGDHPLGDHDEIGWRMNREAWGYGFTAEAATAAIHDVFTRIGLKEVLAYTGEDNPRSQAVMRRLKLTRDPSRDFVMQHDRLGAWKGLVWVTSAKDWDTTK